MHLPHIIEEHPWESAAIILVVGLILVWMLFGGSKAPAQSGDGGALNSYYAAQAAEAASGNQLQATQVAANAAVTSSYWQNYFGTQVAGLNDTAAQNVVALQTNVANNANATASYDALAALSQEYQLSNPGALSSLFPSPGTPIVTAPIIATLPSIQTVGPTAAVVANP